jgi:hypothetical protein
MMLLTAHLLRKRDDARLLRKRNILWRRPNG